MWLNGVELQPSPATSKQIRFTLRKQQLAVNDYNLIVVKADSPADILNNGWQLDLIAGTQRWEFEPIWQVRTGEDAHFANIPLPAKFGMGPDSVLRFKAK